MYKLLLFQWSPDTSFCSVLTVLVIAKAYFDKEHFLHRWVRPLTAAPSTLKDFWVCQSVRKSAFFAYQRALLEKYAQHTILEMCRAVLVLLKAFAAEL
jgi:hypothetical protein